MTPEGECQRLWGTWPRLGLRLSEPQLLHDGAISRIYRVTLSAVGPRRARGRSFARRGQAVVKVSHAGSARAGLAVEASALKRLAGNGKLPVPRALALRRAGPKAALLMAHVAGSRRHQAEAYGALGRLLARLHQVQSRGCGPAGGWQAGSAAAWMSQRLTWAQRRLVRRYPHHAQRLLRLGDGVLRRLQEQVTVLPPAWCHGDPGTHNLLLSETAAVLIDFGQAHRFVAEADLAHLLARLVSPLRPVVRNWQAAAAAVRAYRRAGGALEAAFLHRVDGYMALHWLETAAGLLGAGSGGAAAEAARRDDLLAAVERRLGAHAAGTMEQLLVTEADHLFGRG